MLLTASFFIYPFVNAILLAFYQTNGPRTRVFVGLENFRFLLSDSTFHTALWNTTVFACASVFLQLPLSMGLALLLNRGHDRVKGLFRLILFSPNLVGQIFVGILFAVLFTPRYGLINRTFQALLNWGLEERWLSNPNLVMPAIVLNLYLGQYATEYGVFLAGTALAIVPPAVLSFALQKEFISGLTSGAVKG